MKFYFEQDLASSTNMESSISRPDKFKSYFQTTKLFILTFFYFDVDC